MPRRATRGFSAKPQAQARGSRVCQHIIRPRIALVYLAIASIFPTLVAAPALSASDEPAAQAPAGAQAAAAPVADNYVAVSMNSPEIAELPAAAQDLLFLYPGAEASVFDGRVAAFHSAPMTRGATAEEAEQAFWADHADAFGVSNLSLTLARSHDIAGGKFTVFAYAQRIDGLPVEYATGRVLVRNEQADTPAKVTLASGRFVDRPMKGFAPILIATADAIAVVAEEQQFGHLTNWTAPELVVYAGEEGRWGHGLGGFGDPVRCWKFTGEYSVPDEFEKKTFLVDAAMGSLVHVRDEVYSTDVTGTVKAWVTPYGPNACYPDNAAHPPTMLVGLPELSVSILGGESAYSDLNGNFVIPHSDSTPVTITSNVSGGFWVDVNTSQGVEVADSELVTPPGPANLVFNEVPTQFSTAQANVYLHMNLIHRFFTDRTSWTGLNYQVVPMANFPAGCNARFTGGVSFEFHHAGGACVNSAYSTVIAHEYGHFVIQQLGVPQSAFGEGFGDACAHLLYDDPIIGREFDGGSSGCGDPPRDYSNVPTYTYPCTSSDIHCCGMQLSSLWRDLRIRLGIAPAQQLFVDWAQITNGGVSQLSAAGTQILPQSLHPITIIEVLTADDNDGNLGNGTPNCAAICAAATSHNVACNGTCGPPTPPDLGWTVSFRYPVLWRSAQNGGNDPYGLALGHLNSDNLLDLVLVCEASNNVLVYLGESASPTGYTFHTPTAYALDSAAKRPGKVVLADVTLPGSPTPDGNLDLVISVPGDKTVPNSDGVQILLNLGDGTFDSGDPAKSQFYQFAGGNPVQGPLGIAVMDWDDNSRNDIAVAGYYVDGQGIQRPALGVLWAHATNGTYLNYTRHFSTAAGRGSSLHTWIDLEVIGPNSPTSPSGLYRFAMTNTDSQFPRLFILKYISPQSLSLIQAVQLPTVPAYFSRSVTSAILDPDSRIDLATDFDWFRQRPDDGFTRIGNLPTASGGDVDCGLLTKRETFPFVLDSRIDLAHVNDGASYVFIQANSGSGDLTKLFDVFAIPLTNNPLESLGTRQVRVIDLNQDGFPDVVTSNRGTEGSDNVEGFTVLLNLN